MENDIEVEVDDIILKDESDSTSHYDTNEEPKCCAPGCETRQITEGMTLYHFPDPLRQTLKHRIWKQLLLITGDVHDSDTVCNVHFNKESFTLNKDFTRTKILRSDAFPCATSKFILPLEKRQEFAGMKIGEPNAHKRKRRRRPSVEVIHVEPNIVQEEIVYMNPLEDQSDLIVEESILYEEIE